MPALKLDLNLKTIPAPVKIVIAVAPAIILVFAVIFLLIMPKQKEIKTLDQKIDEQNNKIASSAAKAAKLDFLIKENEKLQRRLAELREYLPEEKEVSGLLKEVSDRAIDSGLIMKSWKPGQKTTHPSGIVYEIPVAVEVSGVYHDFGRFLSSLTKLNRIVNVGNLKFAPATGAKATKGPVEARADLQITFTASTFSVIPDDEKSKDDKSKKGPAAKAPEKKP